MEFDTKMLAHKDTNTIRHVYLKKKLKKKKDLVFQTVTFKVIFQYVKRQLIFLELLIIINYIQRVC